MGFVPVDSSALAPGTVVPVKRKGGAARVCQKCQCAKPPRAHHCRQCGRCVLRMDHHCAWLNNCVGHRNYKAFFLFLLYATVALVHATFLMISFTMVAPTTLAESFIDSSTGLNVDNRQSSSSEMLEATSGIPAIAHIRSPRRAGSEVVAWRHQPARRVSVFIGYGSVSMSVLQTLATTLSAPLSIALALLLAWHLYLVITDKTTIEHHEGVTAAGRCAAEGVNYGGHPFDRGAWRNLHAVLGPWPILWLWPCARASAGGDGICYSSIL